MRGIYFSFHTYHVDSDFCSLFVAIIRKISARDLAFFQLLLYAFKYFFFVFCLLCMLILIQIANHLIIGFLYFKLLDHHLLSLLWSFPLPYICLVWYCACLCALHTTCVLCYLLFWTPRLFSLDLLYLCFPCRNSYYSDFSSIRILFAFLLLLIESLLHISFISLWLSSSSSKECCKMMCLLPCDVLVSGEYLNTVQSDHPALYYFALDVLWFLLSAIMASLSSLCSLSAASGCCEPWVQCWFSIGLSSCYTALNPSTKNLID